MMMMMMVMVMVIMTVTLMTNFLTTDDSQRRMVSECLLINDDYDDA